MKFACYTLGCKVNQYETEVLAELFRARGYEVVSPDAEAEVCLLNSCTVTSTGDQKTRQLLRRMKKRKASGFRNDTVGAVPLTTVLDLDIGAGPVSQTGTEASSRSFCRMRIFMRWRPSRPSARSSILPFRAGVTGRFGV